MTTTSCSPLGHTFGALPETDTETVSPLRPVLVCYPMYGNDFLLPTSFHLFSQTSSLLWAVQLLTHRQILSVYKTSIPLTGLCRSMADLLGMQVPPLCTRHTLGTRWKLLNLALRLSMVACGKRNGISFRSIYLRGRIASRFRITALALRINLTSRLWLQGKVSATWYDLTGSDFHRPILPTPNW